MTSGGDNYGVPPFTLSEQMGLPLWRVTYPFEAIIGDYGENPVWNAVRGKSR